SDPKNANPPTSGALPAKDKGVRIFTYPKVIFMFPTMIAALICGLGMMIIRDRTIDPTKDRPLDQVVAQAREAAAAEGTTPEARVRRFTSPQNVLSMIFLGIFAFNILIMAIDFPRFTLIAGILLFAMFTFLFLWVNAYYDLIPPLVKALE